MINLIFCGGGVIQLINNQPIPSAFLNPICALKSFGDIEHLPMSQAIQSEYLGVGLFRSFPGDSDVLWGLRTSELTKLR